MKFRITVSYNSPDNELLHAFIPQVKPFFFAFFFFDS